MQTDNPLLYPLASSRYMLSALERSKRLLYEREQYGGMICLCLCVSDPTGEVGVGVVDLAPSEYLEVKVQLMFLSQI